MIYDTSKIFFNNIGRSFYKFKRCSINSCDINSHFPCFKCPLKTLGSSSWKSFRLLKFRDLHYSKVLEVFIPLKNNSSITPVKVIQSTESNKLGLNTELGLWRLNVVCTVRKKWLNYVLMRKQICELKSSL